MARLSRLYVVLLPALLLGGALDWLGMHMAGTEAVYSGNSGMHALAFNVHSALTWPILAANGLFLQTIQLPGFGHSSGANIRFQWGAVELELRVLVLSGLSGSGFPSGQEPVLDDARPLVPGSFDLGMVCRIEYRFC